MADRFTNDSSYSSRYIRELMSDTIQSNPSRSPAPVTALQLTIFQCRVPIEGRSSTCKQKSVTQAMRQGPHYRTVANIPPPLALMISSLVSAPSRSCLFARMSRVAPASFSSSSREWSSRRQSSSRLPRERGDAVNR